MAETDWIIIPARHDSSRLPGKPLAQIHGRPMIHWVYERAVAAGSGNVVIATDDERIQEVAAEIDARAVLTSEGHESGTDRLAEVIDFLDLSDETVVVNLQGDEPMMPPALLAQVANLLRAKPDAAMATLMVPIVDREEFLSPDAVKVVVNEQAEAMYFSRAPIPYHRDGMPEAGEGGPFGFRHLGLYAYRAGFLRRFVQVASPAIERLERLEQLRALSMGETIAIAIAEVTPPPGVDNADDLERVRRLMAEQMTV
ncbi:MAG: 3-deoxy-manno-octulosonate cytidylyltransferase [Halothiobacillaceae bacterium]|nr:3-deoxy-manno-octulosonate cytidylyltransferase [Halothiobacillaceae bacterium]HER19420.1 3-deoxy-manno-octulosonate cytidylyltransferase [Chromatiales bacterium]